MSKIQPREMTTPNLKLYARGRGNKVQGNWGTVNLNTIDARRMSMNANSSIMMRSTQSSYGLGNASYSKNISVQNGSNSFYAGQVVGQGITLLGGLINTFASKNTSQTPQGAASQLDQQVSSLGSGAAKATGSDAALAISGMGSCNTAESLGKAITNAQKQLSNMEGMTSKYEELAQEANNTIDSYKDLVGNAEKEQTTAKQGVSTCEQSVKATTANRDRAKEAAKTGQKDYDDALDKYTAAHDKHVNTSNALQRADANKTRTASAYTQAQQDTESARAAYNGIPDTPENAAAKSAAKARLDQAIAAEENAKTAKEQAERDYDSAKQADDAAAKAEDEAKTAKDAAKEKLGDLKGKAEEAEKTLENEQAKLDSAKDNLKQAEINYDDANQKLQDLQNKVESENCVVQLAKNHKNDISALKDAIGEQQKRLKNIQKNEEKEKNNQAKLGDKKTNTGS